MIHALHGNFGLPSDWDAALPPGVPARAWHLWEIRRHHPEARTLTGFATWFNNQVAALTDNGPRILAGYSLGGRLALHVLLDQPELWHRALILSTHHGLTHAAGRIERLTHDARWRGHCLTAAWESVLHDWNTQAVLSGPSQPHAARITEPWRNEIADAFEGWSLGHQQIDPARLGQLPVPGVWMTGTNDPKFCALAQSAMEILPSFHFQTIPQAGHRLLSESPHAIQSCLKELAG